MATKVKAKNDSGALQTIVCDNNGVIKVLQGGCIRDSGGFTELIGSSGGIASTTLDNNGYKNVRLFGNASGDFFVLGSNDNGNYYILQEAIVATTLNHFNLYIENCPRYLKFMNETIISSNNLQIQFVRTN